MIKLNGIDAGRPFDWGNTSKDYAKYRDIYPEAFYKCILDLGLCKDGQRVLDIGTGTGVLPRNMYKYGAKWTGTDISENQIEQAKLLAAEHNMDIEFYACPAEEVEYSPETFDVITVCQCIWYLNAKVFPENFAKMLKPGGKLLILYMGWLPFEDEIAGKSEELVLKYNPTWNGCGDTVHPVWVPDEYLSYFDLGVSPVRLTLYGNTTFTCLLIVLRVWMIFSVPRSVFIFTLGITFSPHVTVIWVANVSILTSKFPSTSSPV